MMEAPIRPTETFAWDEPRPHFEDEYVRLPANSACNYDFDPITKRFLMLKVSVRRSR